MSSFEMIFSIVTRNILKKHLKET